MVALAAAGWAADEPPASQPVVRLAATDTAALKAAAGRTVVVHGTVSRTSWYQDRILFVNFQGVPRDTGFAAIARKPARAALDAAFDGDIAAALEGRTVELTGTIVIYRDRPAIEITRPAQVRILPSPASP